MSKSPATFSDEQLSSPEFSTPMMQQYMQLKFKYADCILLFRLGDFYEMFLDDAEIGARVLGIVLTSRSRGKDGRIPMAGIPYHAVDSYLHKLIKAGYKVAICEQLSEPGKGLVEREVVRIITPGTLLDEKILDAKTNNYVMALTQEKDVLGIAVADLSTGDFLSGEVSAAQLSDVFLQLSPAECIIPPDLFKQPAFLELIRQQGAFPISPYTDWSTHARQAPKYLKKTLRVGSLESFGLTHHPIAQQATAALLGYLEYTQKTSVHHFSHISPLITDSYLRMDRSTIANLELFRSLRSESDHHSLINVIDYTKTAMGGRLLKQWLRQPLQKISAIEARLESIAALHTTTLARREIQEQLKRLVDLERLLARLSLKLGTPKDLKTLELSLATTSHLLEILTPSFKELVEIEPWSHLLKAETTEQIHHLTELLSTHLVEEPPIDISKGHTIKSGINTELDQLRQTIHHSREWLAQLETQEREKTGISSLKIRFNQVFGFYIEVSKANLHLVPEYFWRKQTLVNAERFITSELKEHEEIILSAEEKSVALEQQLFDTLVKKVLAQTTFIQRLAHALAELDCLASLAELAELHHYTRPTLSETGNITIKQGRHPVVEQLSSEQRFVPNDIELNHTTQQLLLITGPNMAGKSVLMRQVALITLLAHIGSFVPAESATLSLTDQIFVRSGAADMITAGLSTFMVEMVETAYILRHATERSLIVMDEIGRGTSTYDGISIAWAVAEELVTHQHPGPKTLFATHYHELQALAAEHPDKIKNYHLAITEHEGKPIFLYQLTEGGASHSFGIAVAQLAGVPEKVVNRATNLLHKLESQPSKNSSPQSGLVTKIKNLQTDQLTPLEALNILTELKKQL
jgi:DNA mismatch repair protein MutS